MLINCRSVRCNYVFVTIFFSFICTANTTKRLNCECGVANEAVSPRIVGGQITKSHVYPWVVVIYTAGVMNCGGALINDRYVLTAGHCVKGIKDEDLLVSLGLHDRFSKEGLRTKIERSYLHENFTSNYFRDTNDIALLKLPHSIPFSKTISPICLPHPSSDYSDSMAVVVGWGRIGVNMNLSRFLLGTNITVLHQNACLNTTLGPYLDDSMMCAYATEKDACQGDSGGPLAFKNEIGKFELIGIVSWGIGCATPGFPGVYTRVQKYLKWIASHTGDAQYCAR